MESKKAKAADVCVGEVASNLTVRRPRAGLFATRARARMKKFHRGYVSVRMIVGAIVALVLPSARLTVAQSVCRQCDATRPCATCSIDVAYATELSPESDDDDINLFTGTFTMTSVHPEALASWQVTWIFPNGQGVHEGRVEDALLINPGGPSGQPARVVNQLGIARRQFSFTGYVTKNSDIPSNILRVAVNGVWCTSPVFMENSAVSFIDDGTCARREYQFCCGRVVPSPPPYPPPAPPAPPKPPTVVAQGGPTVVAQGGVIVQAAASGTAWLRNGSTMSALLVACLVVLVFMIEIIRQLISCMFGKDDDVPLANVDVDEIIAPAKRKNTLMLPGQCFRTKDYDLEGVVARAGDDTARMNAGSHPLRRGAKKTTNGDLFEASLATYAESAKDANTVSDDDDDDDVVEIHLSNIKLGKLIGQGAYGAVYAGRWNKRIVAVKKLHGVSGAGKSDLKTFVREVAVLSAVRHPKIVRMFGACLKLPHLCIVEEMMDGGSLHALLHQDKQYDVSLDDVVRIALDVAQAMAYLHSRSIVHRDLKSHNVLLNGRGAKVADFGIARALERTLLSAGGSATNAATSAGTAGTPAYMAPELFHGDADAVTTKCDVFSFSVLLWELLARTIPWEWFANHMQIIFAVAIQSQRLPLDAPSFARDDVVVRVLVDDVIVPSWQTVPDARPDFTELIVVLTEALRELLARGV